MGKSRTKKLARDKADRRFSEYIRKRDAHNGICKCVTCGKMDSANKFDAGHFISRNYQATRYDEQNVHAQCRKCNRFESGRQYEHGLKIDEMYGEGTAEQLYIKSKMICKRTKSDFERIAEEYKDKC